LESIGEMNLHKGLAAAFGGFVLTVFCWLLLNALWNRLGPDYAEDSVLAVWRIPQLVQRCIGGFMGGYLAAWIGGGGEGRKVLCAAMAAVPFAYMTYGMHSTVTGSLSASDAALLDQGVPALFTVVAGWIEYKFPLQP
jgi:hypothetical protein